jgi:septal ring-binding cell division protein DamX
VTKPKVINFQLARSGVVLIIIGSFVIGVLLVAAGYMAGLAASSKAALPLSTQTAPAAATIAANTNTTSTTAATTAASDTAAATTAVTTTATTTAPTAPAEEAFSLRVKTFGSEAEAKAEQVALKGKQIESVIVTLPPEGGGAVIYSVETGHYATRAEASAASASLAEKSDVQTAVVPAAPLPKPPG